MDFADAAHGRHVDAEPLGGKHLRHKADIREPRLVTETKPASHLLPRKDLLASAEAIADPPLTPLVDASLVLPELGFQVLKDPKVLQRMDIAGDNLGKCPNLRALVGAFRK